MSDKMDMDMEQLPFLFDVEPAGQNEEEEEVKADSPDLISLCGGGGDHDEEDEVITDGGEKDLSSDGLSSSSGSEDSLSDDQLTKIFDILPVNDVRDRIFARLPTEDLQSVREVCKKWEHFANPLMEFRPYLFDYGIPEFKEFLKKKLPIENLNVSQLRDFEYPVEGLGYNQRVKSLQFLPFTTLSNYDTAVGISAANLPILLNDLKNVKKMRLHSKSFEAIQMPSPFQTIEMQQLEDLEISTSDGDGAGFFICLDPLVNTFPRLTRISLSIFFADDAEPILEDMDNLLSTITRHIFHFIPYYKCMYEFLVKHKDTLKSVEFSQNHNDATARDPRLANVDHDIPEAEFDSLMEGLATVQLDDLAFSPSPFEGRRRYTFGVQLVKHQTALTILELTQLSATSIGVYEAGIRAIRQCCNTLKKVYIHGCFCPNTQEVFSCLVLKPCQRLEEFKIAICGLEVTEIENNLPASLSSLHLGNCLTRPQIDFIISSMTNLEELYLPQGKAQLDTTVPKVTVDIFKAAVKLPNLTKLVVNKRLCQWKRIKKLISYTRGLEISEQDEKRPFDTDISIDRSTLEPDRL